MKKEIWFKAKKWGFGWYPANYKGWAVIGVYTLMVIALTPLIELNQPLLYTAIVILLTGALIYVSYKKGEDPFKRK